MRALTAPCYARFITRHAAISLFALVIVGCGSSDAASPSPARAPASSPSPVVEATTHECEDAPDCGLVHRGCCPPCEAPELAEVAAVSGRARDAFRRAECPEPLVCPACVAPTNEHLFATCVAGTCEAIDVRADALSACASDDECVVIGRDCCNCDPRYVAVRSGQESAYYRAQCGEVPLCSPCEPHEVPARLIGRCTDRGHCAVQATVRGLADEPSRSTDN